MQYRLERYQSFIQNFNNAYSKFLEFFLSLYNHCFPKIKVKLKTQRQFNLWITKGIRKSSKETQKLYETFLKKRTKQSETEYKVYEIMFESIKHKSKKIIAYKKKAKRKQTNKPKNTERYERIDK